MTPSIILIVHSTGEITCCRKPVSGCVMSRQVLVIIWSIKIIYYKKSLSFSTCYCIKLIVFAIFNCPSTVLGFMMSHLYPVQLYPLDIQVMLILILTDVQYSQNAVFSFEKGSDCQNQFSGSLHPVKKFLPVKILILSPPTSYCYLENPDAWGKAIFVAVCCFFFCLYFLALILSAALNASSSGLASFCLPFVLISFSFNLLTSILCRLFHLFKFFSSFCLPLLVGCLHV